MIKAFIITAVYFVIIDIPVIMTVISKIYQSNLPKFVELDFKALPSILFYLIFIYGLVHFVIMPNKTHSIQDALLNGGLYGLVTYATYALTVFAVMNIFNWNIVLSDILWGVILSATVSALTIYTLSKIS